MARLIVKTYDVTNPKYILPILDALKKDSDAQEE